MKGTIIISPDNPNREEFTYEDIIDNGDGTATVKNCKSLKGREARDIIIKN